MRQKQGIKFHSQTYNCGRIVRIIVIFIYLHSLFYFRFLCEHIFQKSLLNTCLHLKKNVRTRQKALMVKLLVKSSSWWLHMYWEKHMSLHTLRPTVKLAVTKAVVVIQYWAENAGLPHRTSPPNLTTK